MDTSLKQEVLILRQKCECSFLHLCSYAFLARGSLFILHCVAFDLKGGLYCMISMTRFSADVGFRTFSLSPIFCNTAPTFDEFILPILCLFQASLFAWPTVSWDKRHDCSREICNSSRKILHLVSTFWSGYLSLTEAARAVNVSGSVT